MEVTRETLNELGAGDIPMIYVYNKADKCQMSMLPKVTDHQIYMSAVDGVGILELAELIKSKVYADNVDCTLIIPYNKGAVASYFMENATVLEQSYEAEGIYLRVNCHKQDAEKYREYIKK